MKTFTITNDFHNTSATLKFATKTNLGYELSPAQVRRARRTLCGQTDCRCGNNLKMRGPQRDARLKEISWNNGETVLVLAERA